MNVSILPSAEKCCEALLDTTRLFTSNDPARICLFKVNNRNTRTRCENVFKFNNKDTRTTSLSFALFWCLYC